MPKQKITISLDTEIAEKLRLQSMKKYGNSRSMSRLIEDLTESTNDEWAQKYLQYIHDKRAEELKKQFGEGYQNMGRVCVVSRGNTVELWCNDCQNGFDAFIGTDPKDERYHCPYCGETNTRERKPDWTPGTAEE